MAAMAQTLGVHMLKTFDQKNNDDGTKQDRTKLFDWAWRVRLKLGTTVWPMFLCTPPISGFDPLPPHRQITSLNIRTGLTHLVKFDPL